LGSTTHLMLMLLQYLPESVAYENVL
jgi:hypothetical protein